MYLSYVLLIMRGCISWSLSSKWTLVGGINVGVTPYDPKFGLTFGIKYSGSFRKKSL
jgi:hypothetical protein